MNYTINLLVFTLLLIPVHTYGVGVGLPKKQNSENDRKSLSIRTKEQPWVNEQGHETAFAIRFGADIGVFVTNAKGKLYDQNASNNIEYTWFNAPMFGAVGTYTDSPLYLKIETGFVYAYYPRQNSDVSLSSIPISNDGTDWMYTPKPFIGVNSADTTAILEMEHIMSIINVVIDCGAEMGSAPVRKIELCSQGWASSATLDLKTGKIGNYNNVGDPLIINNVGDLSAGVLSHSFWVLSNEKPSACVIDMIIGDEGSYTNHIKLFSEKDILIERGKVYTFKITIDKDNIYTSENF